MTPNRDREITRAFVSLTAGLANGEDLLEMLDRLTADCARLLDVASAGLLLADRRGALHVMAASSPATRSLEVFQLQRAEGPCLDCYRSGAPVSVPDLDDATDHWPQFAAAAAGLGFASVHALPMRLRASRLGALGLFGTTVGALNADDLALGQGLADAATVALVQDTRIDARALDQRLHRALTSRVVLEQAKGVIAQEEQLPMDRALDLLRSYANRQDVPLTDVAHSVVERAVTVHDLRQPARTAP